MLNIPTTHYAHCVVTTLCYSFSLCEDVCYWMITKLHFMLILQCIYAFLIYIYISYGLNHSEPINVYHNLAYQYRKYRNNHINFLSNNASNVTLYCKNKHILLNRRNDYLEDYTTYERILQSSPIQGLNLPEKYYILAIETSCDDTAVAILDNTGNVISEYNKNQSHIIEKYKGIHPAEAKIQHEKCIHQGIEQVFTDSKISVSDIGFIVVTRGPGLELCLRVGYNTALEFGKLHNLPVIASNHLASHIITPIYDSLHLQSSTFCNQEALEYPFLALLLSGGHSQIYVVTSPITYFLLCDSVDSYMGSSLDKAARMLGLYLGNNGAPSLELAAQKGIDGVYCFKEPLNHTQACQFSFSGINSQLERYIALELNKNSIDTVDKLPISVVNNLARGVQSITISHVITQIDKAIDVAETLFGINKLAIVGGVACNQELILRLSEHLHNRNTYEYQKKLSNKFINRQLKIIRKFRNCKRMPKDKLHSISTSDLILKLWNGDISSIYPSKFRTKRNNNMAYVFNNEMWNIILNTFLASIDSLEIQKIVNGLIHLHDTSLHNVVEIAKFSSMSLLNAIINMNNTLLPNRFINSVNYTDKEWKIFVSTMKRCRDNAPMAAWSVLEKLRNNLNIYPIYDVDKLIFDNNDGSSIDVYDKWDLSIHRNLDILCEICKLDAMKLLYDNYNIN